MESGVWSLARVWTALAREARPQVASMTCGLAEWWVMDQKVEAIMLCWRVGGHGGGGPLTADLGRVVRLLLMEKLMAQRQARMCSGRLGQPSIA